MKDHKEAGYGLDLDVLPKTRAEAAAIGSAYFFNGRACKNGHSVARYTKGGQCSFCIRIRNARKRGVTIDSPDDVQAYAIANHVRKIADAGGQTTYVPSRPCKHGHFLRWVSSNNCVQCDADARKRHAQSQRQRRIEKTYGLTPSQHQAMFDAQEGRCAICNRSHSDRFQMHLDHCHSSSRVRGLLCQQCNQGLGLFYDDASILLRAMEYLNA